MTLKELSQLYYLNREIEHDRERLRELKLKARSSPAPNLSGMPGRGSGNRLEQYAAQIIDLEAIISAKLTQCVYEQRRLIRYIAEIPDSLTRQIFTQRFVEGMSWREVARCVGNNTAPSVKMICYRYLEKSQEEN